MNWKKRYTELVVGTFYVLKTKLGKTNYGQNVLEYSGPVTTASANLRDYPGAEIVMSGNYYIRSDVLRPATPQEIQLRKANI